MSEKRKDLKGRNLKNNEYQKKDGRYEFRYLSNGKEYSAYSWRLVESDPTPAGKKKTKALRTLEKEIEKKLQKEIFEGIKLHDAEKTTLNDIFTLYINARKSTLKPTTVMSVNMQYNRYIKNFFGSETIDKISSSRVLEYYVFWRDNYGASMGVIWSLHSILSKLCKIAISEDLIRKNPCDTAFRQRICK